MPSNYGRWKSSFESTSFRYEPSDPDLGWEARPGAGTECTIRQRSATHEELGFAQFGEKDRQLEQIITDVIFVGVDPAPSKARIIKLIR